jgi:ABC-2 type transport system ATP-binding protein
LPKKSNPTMLISMNAISLKNLQKTYSNGTIALKGIDLDIKEGEFFALLGVNGAGKSTIINILSSLVIKTSGGVTVFDANLDTDLNKAKNYIGVVPQEFNFNIFEKVWDILICQAGFYGIPRKEAEQRAEFILKKLSLWDKKDKISRTLSGGMKRRLMIARGLMHMPKILILDEPTAGVDVDLRLGMWEYLKELNQSGTTIILTTHYLEEVEQLCDRAAIIKDGRIVKVDTVSNLVSSLDSQDFVIKFEKSITLSDLNLKQKVVNGPTDKGILVTLQKTDTIGSIIAVLESNPKLQGNSITDISPAGNRLEQLFMQTIKS